VIREEREALGAQTSPCFGFTPSLLHLEATYPASRMKREYKNKICWSFSTSNLLSQY